MLGALISLVVLTAPGPTGAKPAAPAKAVDAGQAAPAFCPNGVEVEHAEAIEPEAPWHTGSQLPFSVATDGGPWVLTTAKEKAYRLETRGATVALPSEVQDPWFTVLPDGFLVAGTHWINQDELQNHFEPGIAMQIEVVVERLAPDGKPRWTTRLSSADSSWTLRVAVTGDRVLLAWLNMQEHTHHPRLALLSLNDGKVVGRLDGETDVADAEVNEDERPAIAAAADGFLVLWPPAKKQPVGAFVHVGLDGAVDRLPFPIAVTQQADLLYSDKKVLLAYTAADGQLHVANLDPRKAALSSDRLISQGLAPGSRKPHLVAADGGAFVQWMNFAQHAGYVAAVDAHGRHSPPVRFTRDDEAAWGGLQPASADPIAGSSVVTGTRVEFAVVRCRAPDAAAAKKPPPTAGPRPH